MNIKEILLGMISLIMILILTAIIIGVIKELGIAVPIYFALALYGLIITVRAIENMYHYPHQRPD